MRIVGITFFFLVFVGVFSVAFTSKDSVKKQSQNKTYHLNKPDIYSELPEILFEVSGLTDLYENKIACVQDEKGIIYTYNYETHEIENEFRFADDFDYEGLTRVNNELYVLSSDGKIYETSLSEKQEQTKKYDLQLPTVDNEGLCYDEKHNRLLIAPKSRISKDSENAQMRAVYIFDLESKTRKSEPLFYFTDETIYQFAEENKIPTPTFYKKNGDVKPKKIFRPSSIAVHPLTHDIYIISADDFGLAVFDDKGTIKNYSALPQDLFAKAEGITFLKDGTMIITNEGVNHKGTLLGFRLR